MTKTFDIIGLTDETTIVAGDDKELDITVPNIPDTQLVSQAWFTVRSVEGPDGVVLLQKVITPTNQIGIGQITDTGEISHICGVRVDLTEDDTPLLEMPDPLYGVAHFYYSLHVDTSSGKLETALKGQISALRGVPVGP